MPKMFTAVESALTNYFQRAWGNEYLYCRALEGTIPDVTQLTSILKSDILQVLTVAEGSFSDFSNASWNIDIFKFCFVKTVVPDHFKAFRKRDLLQLCTEFKCSHTEFFQCRWKPDTSDFTSLEDSDSFVPNIRDVAQVLTQHFQALADDHRPQLLCMSEGILLDVRHTFNAKCLGIFCDVVYSFHIPAEDRVYKYYHTPVGAPR